ncbi:Dimer-Tnp-hAT domain containing protein, partial [Pyrenophora tritici-repentis]
NEEDEYEAWKRSEPIASEGVDPIKYWVGLRDRYPSLSKFAIDMLSIPGSSCECERLFSELGDLLEPRRRSISPQLLAAIQCDRRWIRAGFGSGEVPVKEAISDEEMDAKYANPSEPSELLASAQLAEQANWLSSLSLLIDICAIPLVEDWGFGSSKIIPKELQAEYEPDIIIKMPGKGDNQRERIAGEMKFFGTCKIEPGWGKPNSQGRGSMRHVFGQVARDMRERGLRFGFVSTYEETVFLKIGRQESDGSYALFYSDIVRHTDRTVMASDQKVLASISVRLGLLYLLHRASHEDESTWSFNPSDIKPLDWTYPKPSKKEGEQANPYHTPNTGLIQANATIGDLSPSIARGIANIQLASRNTRVSSNLAAARTARSKAKQDTEERIDRPQ